MKDKSRKQKSKPGTAPRGRAPASGAPRTPVAGEPRPLSFIGHLEELRKRIIWVLIAVAVTGIIGYLASGFVLEILARPIGKLYFFAPAEAFLIRFKIALIIGIALALPFILYQAWRFVTPALTGQEKKYVLPAIFVGFILFWSGVAFAHFLLIPVGMKMLLSFGTKNIISLMNVSKYINFILWMLFFAGVLFETPLVIFFLAKLGIIEPRTLRKHRKTAIVIIFIVAAVITPSVDWITMTILAVPLVILYEASIWIAHFTRPKSERRKKK